MGVAPGTTRIGPVGSAAAGPADARPASTSTTASAAPEAALTTRRRTRELAMAVPPETHRAHASDGVHDALWSTPLNNNSTTAKGARSATRRARPRLPDDEAHACCR